MSVTESGAGPGSGSELGRMRELAAEWDRLLREGAHAPRVPELLEDLRARHLVMGSRSFCPVLRPYLVTPGQLEADRRAAETALSALLKVVRRLRGDRRLAERYLGPYLEAHAALLELDAGYRQEVVLGRFDGFRTPQGLRFFEYNQGLALAFIITDRLAGAFEEMKVMKAFRQRRRVEPLLMTATFFDAVLAAYRDWGGQGTPRMALAMPPTFVHDPVYRAITEQGLDLMAQAGIHAVVADPAELEFDGTRLRHGGEPIDLVLRVFFTEEALGPSTGGLLAALRARAVCMVSRFSWNGHKAVFDPLTDPAVDCGLTGEEREVVRRHVPWTRLVRETVTTGPDGAEVDLVAHSTRSRERLVLKSVGGHGGKEVLLGWRSSEGEWEARLAEAVRDRCWVVQERVDAPVEGYPLLQEGLGSALFRSDCSPTFLDGKMAGYVVRLSPGEITNVSSGGGAVPVFAVHDGG